MREGKGQTQVAMDEYFGLPRGTVSNWENGFAQPEELLEESAHSFGVKVHMLKQGKNE